MRRVIAGLAAVLLMASLAVGVSAGAPDDQGQRIVLSADDAARNGIAVRHNFEHGKASAHVSAAQIKKLADAGVSYEIVPVATTVATPAAKGKPGGGGSGGGRTVPSYQVPYGIKMIYGDPNLTAAGVSGGAGVTVAVLDTGATLSHPDYVRADGSSIIAACVDFADRTYDVIEGQCTDGDGHGTHVIGTIAAAGGADGRGIFGVAPNASIYAYRVLNNQGRGYADDIARAITYAADHGANIISMSLGGSSGSSLYLDAIRYANSKGVLVIAAAGNSGPNANTIGYPGAYKEVVAVASLNADEVVSYYSSRGITDGNDNSIVDREVEVAGPGRSVLSTAKSGGYELLSGTSMATPHISGLAAKIWTNASGTRSALVNSAQNHDITRAEQINNAGTGYDIAAGYGLPQVRTLSQSLWKN
ncbi:MAG TPA: S8 family serine peptidase [Symbiobacteriaceae bacterium]|nr:S8 family serine peptidase [Symbiobacteriaceae bacterium]